MDTALYLEFVEICGVCGVYFETTNWTTKDDYHHRGRATTVPSLHSLYCTVVNTTSCRRLSTISYTQMLISFYHHSCTLVQFKLQAGYIYLKSDRTRKHTK